MKNIFVIQLTEMVAKYQQDLSDTQVCNLTERRLQVILQEYLWNGILFKSFDENKYKALCLKWHPDKIEHIINSNDASLSEDQRQEKAFLKWFVQLQGKNCAFNVLKNVKDKYDPLLKMKLSENIPSNTGSFYKLNIYNNFKNNESSIFYNIFFPVYYTLQKLEQNIIKNEKHRFFKQAPKGRFALTVILGLVLCITYPMLFLKIFGYGVVLGVTSALTAMLCQTLTNKDFIKAPQALNGTNTIFLVYLLIPFQMLKQLWLNLRHPSEASLSHYITYGFVFLGVLAWTLLQTGIVLNILYMGSSAFIVAEAINALPVILVNIPMLLSSALFSPIHSLKTIGNTCLEIAVFYAVQAQKIASTLSDVIKSLIPTWLKNLTEKGKASEAQPVAPQPEEQPVPPSPSVQPQQNILPYWKKKLDKYLQKPVDASAAEAMVTKYEGKAKASKKIRDAILIEMGANKEKDCSLFETLDEELSVRSAVFDEHGHTMNDVPDHMVDALSHLNYKAQAIYFKSCQTEHKPLRMAFNERPKNLDYHSFLEKPGKIAMG